MTRKSMVLVLAAVLAIAVAIPVVAQERVVTPKLQKISKRALKKSNTALRTSRIAGKQAGAAVTEAQAAAQVAAAAQGGIASTRVEASVASAPVTTTSAELVQLAGGPAVQVTVPSSGLIEVWAQATVDGEGKVALFEDGQLLPGQADCLEGEGPGVLFSNIGSIEDGVVLSTPAALSLSGICATLGPPGPVLFQTTPGAHTYELRYARCGCKEAPEEVTFSNRRLFVGPRL
jgi:hypothetical protein